MKGSLLARVWKRTVVGDQFAGAAATDPRKWNCVISTGNAGKADGKVS